jgi:hypothetical protein
VLVGSGFDVKDGAVVRVRKGALIGGIVPVGLVTPLRARHSNEGDKQNCDNVFDFH